MNLTKITIATRQSLLAMAQTEWVKARLLELYPHLHIDVLGITTKADKILDRPLDKMGGKGLFVKELEEALYAGTADIAVHSMKDVPMDLPEGLCLPIICEREDPRDAFVSNDYATLAELPPHAVVGTSSIRRNIQVKQQNPHIQLATLRGNIHTRLRRLDAGDFAAIILAVAGLKRMAFTDRIRHALPLDKSIPAAGQGALGIECRQADTALIHLLMPLNHTKSQLAITAERALCRRIGGGCSIPIAAYATIEHDVLRLHGFISNPDGSRILRTSALGEQVLADTIGLHAAEDLIAQGALDLVKEFK